MGIVLRRAETVWLAAPFGITGFPASAMAFPPVERLLIFGSMADLRNFQARIEPRADGKRDATALGKSRDQGSFPLAAVFVRDDGRASAIRHMAFELGLKQRGGFFMLVDHAGKKIGHDDGPNMFKAKLPDQLLMQGQQSGEHVI